MSQATGLRVALVDCNNFYASCERLFRPELEGKPVVVLSNNDGCIIARSSEAKTLGIDMGEPYFKIQNQLRKHKVAVFSSNYPLYGDLSRRVMSTLLQFSPDVEVYSIDEAFMNLVGCTHGSDSTYAHRIQQTVKQWTGIPVSIGIASTKTLAKIANRIAKKTPGYHGILDLSQMRNVEDHLTRFDISDIWGIGFRLSVWLRRQGIHNAWQLRNMDEKIIQKKMGIVGTRLLQELRGIPCHRFQLESRTKKEIGCSRTFRRAVRGITPLKQAIATFTARVAEKLRSQNSLTRALGIYLFLNAGASQYHYTTVAFPVPTNDTGEMIHYALRQVEELFRPNIEYKKAQVTAFDLLSGEAYQSNFFDDRDRDRMFKLMRSIDSINRRMGAGTVRYAAMGINPGWSMKQKYLSPSYTTSWSGLYRLRVR